MDTSIATCYGMNPLLDHSDMARDSNGSTQFYLSPTHEPYLSLLPNCRASPPIWLVHIVPTHGGMVKLSDLGGWLYTEIDFPALGVEPLTGHPSQY